MVLSSIAAMSPGIAGAAGSKRSASAASEPAPLVIARDPAARSPRALGDVITWVHDGDRSQLYRRFQGRWGPAPRVPRAVNVFGDLGRDARGTIVQVLGACEESVLHCRWSVYDARAGRLGPLRLPRVARGCAIRDVAMWYRLTAVAVACPMQRRAFILRREASSVGNVMRVERFDDATTKISVDVGDGAIAARLLTATDEVFRSRSWVIRDGCRPRVIAVGRDFNLQNDPPQVDSGSVYWVTGSVSPRTARLMVQPIVAGCRPADTRTALTLPDWESHLEATVLGRSVFMTRNDEGVTRLRLP
jgi:hypothetical protein